MRDAISQTALDLLEQPVFLVREETIVFCNRAAVSLGIEVQSLPEILGPAMELYREYDGSGFASLPVRLEGRERTATVCREEAGDLFLVSALPAAEGLSLESLSVLSQSLRQPLTSAFTVASTLFPLLEEEENPVIQRQTAQMNQSLYQLLRLAGNLTDMSRLLADEMPMFEERTELGIFLEHLAKKIEPLCVTAGFVFRYLRPAGQVWCSSDQQKVERAILNLISNAMKFTPAGGTITLKLEATAACARIRVTDTGEGMPPEILATAFERFAHRSAVGDARWGMGLGLPFVRQVARLHEGTLILESRPLGGTSATMTLSLRRRQDPKQLRSPQPGYDYAGGFQHCLVELADVLPRKVYDSVNVN